MVPFYFIFPSLHQLDKAFTFYVSLFLRRVKIENLQSKLSNKIGKCTKKMHTWIIDLAKVIVIILIIHMLTNTHINFFLDGM